MARTAGDRSSPRKAALPALSVGFILAPRFTLCAFASFVDVLRLAADEGDRSRPILCAWSVLSRDLAPIASSCGISIRPQESLGDPRRFDYIVVVGGLIEPDVVLHPDYARFIQKAANLGISLIGICTGSFALYAAGVMNGYRCCVSWFHHDDFIERFDGMEPVANQIFVVDRDRLTCAGGVSSAHLAAHLVDRHIGADRAQKSLNIMMIDTALDGEVAQPHLDDHGRPNDPLLRKALLLMRQHMQAPLSAKDLAVALKIGRRQLERRFQTLLGMGPAAACRALRLNHARTLLERGRRSVAQIAIDCGFSDASHFARHFRRAFQTTPSLLRTQSAGQ